MKNILEFVDNLNHEIHIGDVVFCLTGSAAKTISVVKKLGKRSNPPFDDEATATLENGKTVCAINVVSLSALNVQADAICAEQVGKEKCDALGHRIQVGDNVLFLHRMECLTETGSVIKLSPTSCLIAIKKNRFGQTEYRQKYSDIINLSAIDLGNMRVQLSYFSNEDRCQYQTERE